MHYLLILISVLLLSSCVINRTYEPPSDGKTATILFINNSIGLGTLEFFQQQDTCKGRINGPYIKIRENTEVKVRANEPLSFSFGYGVAGGYCRIYATFTPLESKYYSSTIYHRSNSCSLETVVSEKNVLVPVKLQYRKPKKFIFDENSSFCH